MKFIKKYESFHETGVDEGGEVVPEINPKRKSEITSFLDDLTPSERPFIFTWLRYPKEQIPKVSAEDFDDKFEEAKIKFTDYLMKNPNIVVSQIDKEKFIIPKQTGDGAPRVQNIGGSSLTNSFRIGQ